MGLWKLSLTILFHDLIDHLGYLRRNICFTSSLLSMLSTGANEACSRVPMRLRAWGRTPICGRRHGPAGGEGWAGLPPVPLKLRPQGCDFFTNTFIYWCQHLASSHGEWPESLKKIRYIFPEGLNDEKNSGRSRM